MPRLILTTLGQGCQMVYIFAYQKPIRVYFGLVNVGIHILQLLGISCGSLAYFVVIWYIFTRFGMKNLATLHLARLQFN
jgi:hypothetical protein